MSAEVQVEMSAPHREFYVRIDGEYVGAVWRRPRTQGKSWSYSPCGPVGDILVRDVRDGFDSYEAALNRLIREVRPDVWRENRGPVWSLRYSTEAPELLSDGLQGWGGDDNERYPWRLIDPEGATVNGTWRSEWRKAHAELQAAARGEELEW